MIKRLLMASFGIAVIALLVVVVGQAAIQSGQPVLAVGEGGRIAFQSDRADPIHGHKHIFVMDADFNAISVQVGGTVNSEDYEPNWSPDGSRIAFTSGGRRPSPDIFVVNADGSGEMRLTDDPETDAQPAWSPDGSKIAFLSARAGPSSADIYVMDADGSNVIRLTTTPGGNQAQNPTWSPDGNRIAFQRTINGVGGIMVMNADGSGVVNITNAGNSPSWSPDGSKIAFERGGEISTVNPDGSDETSLTNGLGGSHPAWSDDGRIVFSSARDGNSEIYIMKSDGSAQTRLTDDPAIDNDPDWAALPLPPSTPPAVGGIVNLPVSRSGSSGGALLISLIAGAALGMAGVWYGRSHWRIEAPK